MRSPGQTLSQGGRSKASWDRESLNHDPKPLSSTRSDSTSLATIDDEQNSHTGSNRADMRSKGNRKTNFTGAELSIEQLEDGMTAHIDHIVNGWFNLGPEEEELDRGKVSKNK